MVKFTFNWYAHPDLPEGTDHDATRYLPVEVTICGDHVTSVMYHKHKYELLPLMDPREEEFLLRIADYSSGKRNDIRTQDSIRYSLVAEAMGDTGVAGYHLRNSVGNPRDHREGPEDGTREWLDSPYTGFLPEVAGVYERLAAGEKAIDAVRPFYIFMRQEMKEWMSFTCASEDDYDQELHLREIFDSLERIIPELEELVAAKKSRGKLAALKAKKS